MISYMNTTTYCCDVTATLIGCLDNSLQPGSQVFNSTIRNTQVVAAKVEADITYVSPHVSMNDPES